MGKITISENILYHHESWDGSGYSEGLKGENIPYLARIISIIDAYNVMTNDRPYSNAISKEEALNEIEEYVGSQFDLYF
ncbi:MAG: HD-GYP domain-containing protein [Bacillota bacterium]